MMSKRNKTEKKCMYKKQQCKEMKTKQCKIQNNNKCVKNKIIVINKTIHTYIQCQYMDMIKYE